MRTKTNIIMIALLVLLSACNETEETEYQFSSNQIKVVQDENHKTIAEYTYDRKGRLSRYWEKPEFSFDNEVLEFNCQYNSKNQLSGKEGYIPGNPIMSSLVGAMGKDVSETYDYDSNGRLIKVTTSFKFPDFKDYNFSASKEYTYLNGDTVEIRSLHHYQEASSSYNVSKLIFDKTGNLKETRSFAVEEGEIKRMYYTEKFTYDSKHNPFRVTYLPEQSSTNNPIKKEVTYYSIDTQSTSEFTWEYTYNRKGYPTMQKLTNPNETTVVKYLKY